MEKKIKNLRYFVEYCCVLFFFKIVKILPRTVIRVIAWISGMFMYCIPPFRKLTVSNIKAAFPEKDLAECRSISRRSFIHLVRSLLDFFKFNQNPNLIVTDCVYNDRDREICETPHNQGNGLIIVCPHLGSWEIAGLIMKREGYPFAVVAKTIRNPYLDKLINSGRMAYGSHVIPAKGAVRGMVKSLKSGSMVATLIDQNTRVRDGGVFIDFFDLPVPASRAPALFGRKFNVPIVVGGGVYNEDGNYEMFMEKISKTTDKYESDTELIQDIMTVTENIIRKYPEQYLWFYKRFQNIPRDADEEIREKYPYYATIAKNKFYDGNAKA